MIARPDLSFLVLRSELGHFLFGASVALAVAWSAYWLISTISRTISSGSPGYLSSITSRTWVQAGFYILLVSWSVAVCLHVLEDVFYSWF